MPEISSEAGIPHFGQLIGNALEVTLQPFLGFLDSKQRQFLSFPLLLVPSYSVLSIGTVQRRLILVVNIHHACSNIRVYLGASFRTITFEKFNNKPGTAERPKETPS